MKNYTGARTIDGLKVLVDGAPLEERYDLKRFTTWGFEWTYEGDEPSQLALAILADHLNDDAKAVECCERFMREVVANLDNDWQLTGEDIDKALADDPGDRSAVQCLRVGHAHAHHAPADHHARPTADLCAPHPQPSPILLGFRHAISRPEGLAGDVLPALRAGGVHLDVDAGRADPRLLDLGQCRLAANLDDDRHVFDLRIHAFQLPCRRELVRAALPLCQHAAATSHRASQFAADDGGQYEPDLPDLRLDVRHLGPRPRAAGPPFQRLRHRAH